MVKVTKLLNVFKRNILNLTGLPEFCDGLNALCTSVIRTNRHQFFYICVGGDGDREDERHITSDVYLIT